MVMKDFGVTAICCTPSYFLHLIDQAPEMGVNIKDLPLRAGVFGAEPWTESMRQRIEADSGIKAYDIYGLSEIIGPGVAMECQCQAGPHIFEDHFYPEIIDPKTGKPCPDGEEGELVLTTLSKQAMPMIRYRTRDITALASETCACGRTLRRIKRIGRRSDDMFIIRGVNVFPSQIETALLKVEGTLPHYQIVLTREKDLDEMEVQVEVTPEVFSDTVGALEQLQSQAQQVHRNHRGHARQRAAGRAAHHPAQRRQGQARHRPAENVTPRKPRHESQTALRVPGKQTRRAQPARQAARQGEAQHPDALPRRHPAVRHPAPHRARLGKGQASSWRRTASSSRSPTWSPSKWPTSPAAWPRSW